MTYAIEVVGKAWQGFNAAYIYNTKSIPADSEDMEAWVKRISGDFSHVEDYRIIQKTVGNEQQGNKRIHTITEEVIRDFANADSEDKFFACIGGDYA